MGCFSGCLMSSAGIQKLFYGIYSVFKCSVDEFVGEKVVSLSYSSTILGLPPDCFFFLILIILFATKGGEALLPMFRLIKDAVVTNIQKHCLKHSH